MAAQNFLGGEGAVRWMLWSAPSMDLAGMDGKLEWSFAMFDAAEEGGTVGGWISQ